MKTTIKLISALALLSTATGVLAADKPAGSGPNPFSECGIGAALFPKTPVAAVISNVIWDVGTTAVTSATASPETCNGADVQAAAFIYETYDNLVEETAKGEGEHLAALLNILEVSDADKASVVAELRSDLAVIVSSADYSEKTQVEKAEALYNVVAS